MLSVICWWLQYQVWLYFECESTFVFLGLMEVEITADARMGRSAEGSNGPVCVPLKAFPKRALRFLGI